ncbi:hypothetical protein [Geotalea sp. SG265]|uniref:hypothetical protein n=1 Tax=Geotalea sp. SG265 TaxID=2922867 RepID=UPI001FAE8F0E|nr:hypothetical protein [Geotalea sp. SG265]
MSNIYEALQQANNDKRPEIFPGSDVKPPLPGSAPGFANQSDYKTIGTDAEMYNLHQNIDYLLPEPARKIIQFIAAGEREGVSTIVRRFAQTAITNFGKKVLIIDAAHHNPTQHLFFKVDCSAARYGQKQTVCFPVADKSLFLSPLSAQHALIPRVHDREETLGVFAQLREQFDMVLIDSSPGTTSPTSIALSRYADGVVMVVEADKTSRLVAESLKEKISRNGGNLMGIILNRRRFHIPEFIYKRL